jgi:hypothetical protein
MIANDISSNPCQAPEKRPLIDQRRSPPPYLAGPSDSSEDEAQKDKEKLKLYLTYGRSNYYPLMRFMWLKVRTLRVACDVKSFAG